MKARFLYNPIPAIELLLASACLTLGVFLALPPYDSLIAQGLDTFAMIIVFCLISITSGALTILGVYFKKRALRRWGTAGIFGSMLFVSFLIAILAAESTGIWAVTLAQALIAAICHIHEKNGLV